MIRLFVKYPEVSLLGTLIEELHEGYHVRLDVGHEDVTRRDATFFLGETVAVEYDRDIYFGTIRAMDRNHGVLVQWESGSVEWVSGDWILKVN